MIVFRSYTLSTYNVELDRSIDEHDNDDGGDDTKYRFQRVASQETESGQKYQDQKHADPRYRDHR